MFMHTSVPGSAVWQTASRPQLHRQGNRITPSMVERMEWPQYNCGFHAMFYAKDDPFRMSFVEVVKTGWFWYRRHPKTMWHDIRIFFKRAWYGFLVVQPFRCNGWRGGWRTHLCGRMEDKARRYEEGWD